MHKQERAESHDSSSSTTSNAPPAEPWSRSGEGFWRGVRYLACIAVGFALGCFAAGPSLGVGHGLVIVGVAICLWLVFRQGRKSVLHSAADAVATANAKANAAAANVNNITMAGGHVVQGQPPLSAYERDIWADFRGVEPVQAYEVGKDAITGARLYEVNGRIIRYEQLTDGERAAIVPIDAQLARGDHLR
jgi:hypothetical protein